MSDINGIPDEEEMTEASCDAPKKETVEESKTLSTKSNIQGNNYFHKDHGNGKHTIHYSMDADPEHYATIDDSGEASMGIRDSNKQSDHESFSVNFNDENPRFVSNKKNSEPGDHLLEKDFVPSDLPTSYIEAVKNMPETTQGQSDFKNKHSKFQIESNLQELNTERYADKEWHSQQTEKPTKHMVHTADGKKHGPFSSKDNAEKFKAGRSDLKSPKYVAEEKQVNPSYKNVKSTQTSDFGDMYHTRAKHHELSDTEHVIDISSSDDRASKMSHPIHVDFSHPEPKYDAHKYGPNDAFPEKGDALIGGDYEDSISKFPDSYYDAMERWKKNGGIKTSQQKEFYDIHRSHGVVNEELSEEDMKENKLQESETLSLKEAFNDKLGSMTEFKVSISEDVKGIFESQQLDEEVGNQLIAVFESVISSAAKSHLEQINESASELFSELVESKFTQMDEEVSDYLETVVNEWFEENKLQIIESQRVVAVESFIKNLSGVLHSAGLMAECPGDEEKMKEEKVEESQEDQTSVIAGLQEELNAYKKAAVIESICKGLTMVKVEKIRELSEALEFHNVEDYTRKMEILRESISGKPAEETVVEQKPEDEMTTEEIVIESKVEETKEKEPEDEIAFLVRAMKTHNRF